MKNIILLISLLSFSNIFCQKTEDSSIEKLLQGVWVKTTNTHDTLKFGLIPSLKSYFELKPGKGSTKKKVGLYSYSTLDRKMIIHWVYSSSLFNDPSLPFYFEENNKLLKIKNFYSADGESDWLMFKKIN